MAAASRAKSGRRRRRAAPGRPAVQGRRAVQGRARYVVTPRVLLFLTRGGRWLFLEGGPVAKLVGRRSDERLLQADARRSTWGGPLAVLENNGTAGPGEIVAAAAAVLLEGVDAVMAKRIPEGLRW